MQKRREYEIKLRDYPDVVTVDELGVLLNVTTRTVWSLLQKGKIQYFRIKNRYRIPKAYVIDFMMSEEYAAFARNVERVHYVRSTTKEEREREKILFLCETPQTRKDLMYLLDVKSKKTFFRVYLRPLLESGELQMTHPEQPSISTQKYIRASCAKK